MPRLLAFRTIVLCCWMSSRVTLAQPPFDPGEVIHKDSLSPKGARYDATVPDTLDLAEQARLSINGLIGNLDPRQYYGVYQGFSLNREKPAHPYAITWNITVKNARTLPTLRLMNGDDYGLDDERGMLLALLSEIREDGMMYYPFQCQGPPQGTSYPQTNASMIFVMLNHQALDNNSQWQKWIDLLAKGLKRTAIRVQDRAFFPMQAGIDPQGKWHLMNVEGEPPYGRGEHPFTYEPLKEPESDAMGYEGAARAEINRSMAVLARHYAATGDRDSLELSERLLRFSMKPGMWAANMDEVRYPGSEHGIWAGHFHNGTQCLCSLIEVAQATNNNWLKELCREFYENTRRNGVTRIGWFPAWSTPEKCGNRPAVLGSLTEACAQGDMIVAAVMLSDAGWGDYWDDVDAIVRNQLVEQQVVDLEQMRKITGVKPGTPEDERLQHFRGGFIGFGITSMQEKVLAGCCTANGAQGYYYAWHGITRCNNGVAQVNLFLNRASPWMDVDSYLPYEGKVVLRNKTAHTVLVRVPGWLDANQFTCHFQHDDAAAQTPEKSELVKPSRLGNLLVFNNLRPNDAIVLEFPINESTDQYTINGKKYSIKFRGSTVLDITPRNEDPKKDYQIYLRNKYQATKAPMHRVQRFVADTLIPPGSF